MTNEEKAKEIVQKFIPNNVYDIAMTYIMAKLALLQMAQWKDEQYKTAYVVTRSDLHWDEVEKVFFDKKKSEEYCKQFNEDENCYNRNITEIEVSL